MKFYFSPDNIEKLKEIVEFEMCNVGAITNFNDEYTRLELTGTGGWDSYSTIIKNSVFSEFCEPKDLLGCVFPVITNIGSEIRNRNEGISCLILLSVDKRGKFKAQGVDENGVYKNKYSDFSNKCHVCSEFIDEFYVLKREDTIKFKFLNYEYQKFAKIDYLELEMKDDRETRILRLLMDDYSVYTFPGILKLNQPDGLTNISQEVGKFIIELGVSKSKINIFADKIRKTEHKAQKRNDWNDEEYWQTSVNEDLKPKIKEWVKNNQEFVFDFRLKYTLKDFDCLDFGEKFLHSFMTEEEKEQKKQTLIENEDYEGLKNMKEKD